ncbi:MAG TPA: phosphotransferase [Pyrinomonadaceae bacterium]|nr:phosphotransferase [Pyrinomonadaceae bacterium]
MKPELITSLDQISPTWLTGVLRRSRLLTTNSVAEVTFESAVTSFSVIAHLRISYTRKSELPDRLFLKFSKPVHPVSTPEGGWEVVFYKSVAPHTPNVLRCYDAVFSTEHRRLHLLLEDVSLTHYSEPPSQLPPSRRNCELIVQALADIHATWWGGPPWDVIGWTLPDQVEVDRRIKDVSERIARFASFLGDRLTEKRRDTYDEVLAALPDLYTRLTLPTAYTVVHDDIHIGNVLYPRNPETDTVRIIDWQTWLIDLAPKDLAHMMALFWFPEQRRALEIPLLQQYYNRLCENGVSDYSWEQLWNDYRLCVIRKLFHPAWQWDTGHHPNIWWNHLERVMLAYEDLDCRQCL